MAEKDWAEWRSLVLSDLKNLESTVKEVQKDVNRLSVDLAVLNVKAGFWGAVSGFAASMATSLIVILTYLKHQ